MMFLVDRLSDNELLERAPRDPEAFAVFYDRHAGTLIGLLRYRTGSTELALDLAGEVFAIALERAESFRAIHEDSARAWLYGIARNKLADLYRTGKAEDRARRRLGMQPIVLTDKALDALEQRLEAEQSGVLAALELLPAHERQALSARVLDEEPYEQIAARFEVSESVIRQRVSRGLRRLRTLIKETP